MARVLVTSRDLYGESRTRRCLRELYPNAKMTPTGFRAVLLVEAEGDALEVAGAITRECIYDIGRAVPVLAEGFSTQEDLSKLALDVALKFLERGKSFCFRLHKRGIHGLEKPTPDLEYEIGGAIHDALLARHGEKPKVDLKGADVIVTAEVLGAKLIVGIVRREWLV